MTVWKMAEHRSWGDRIGYDGKTPDGKQHRFELWRWTRPEEKS